MKNWKKTLAAVLAGMLCIISMPQVQPVLPAFSAAAAEETGTVGALTYTLKSDRAIITQCDKNAEEVEIPSEIAGKPVLQIAERAFLSHEKLTRVVIPDTVRTIENLAFSHCSQLQELLFLLCTAGRTGRAENGKKYWSQCVLRNGVAEAPAGRKPAGAGESYSH